MDHNGAAETETESLDDRLKRLVQRRRGGVGELLASSSDEEAEPRSSQWGGAVQAFKQYLEQRVAALAPVDSGCAAPAEESRLPCQLSSSSDTISPDGCPSSTKSLPDARPSSQLDREQSPCQHADVPAGLNNLPPTAQRMLAGDEGVSSESLQDESLQQAAVVDAAVTLHSCKAEVQQ